MTPCRVLPKPLDVPDQQTSLVRFLIEELGVPHIAITTIQHHSQPVNLPPFPLLPHRDSNQQNPAPQIVKEKFAVGRLRCRETLLYFRFDDVFPDGTGFCAFYCKIAFFLLFFLFSRIRSLQSESIAIVEKFALEILRILHAFYVPESEKDDFGIISIEESNTKDHLAKATEELQKAIFAACRKAYKIKKFKLKINNNWWNQNLQIKKKELQALKRRTNKSEDDNKLKYHLQLSKKQAELKREAKKAKRNSFRNSCTKTTDPYGRPYKAVAKNKHPLAELFKQLGNPSSGGTKSFALKILQELYPPPHSPVTPPNCFPLTQEPQITKNEKKRILKKASTKKATGFNAIDYIVLKEVNNSFPEILYTFYNKCYQLHCFPEPLKKVIIVLFYKDGKEADKIKSYRPVTLLPTIGKVLEQILLRRLNHTLKKKNILHHN
ncbi:hypothetical protein AVEN_255444-1 [Araneus ventricosus]|uniref:Reverse transcriptase domain-containing protein n=1 Tax=Araneus ventricosus TaxID=182803 RepID=A0A4Y2TRU3_ARAVE|nr:hypothetical protein AVEN_255444-1 [Araneus ventricosus]